METKRLLILANSHKHGGRCLAGREVVVADGKAQLGAWVRPVSGHGEGELSVAERTYPDRAFVSVGDIADVRLAGRVTDACQPENWTIRLPTPWATVPVRFGRPTSAQLQEYPSNLWREPGQKSDRVAHEWLILHPPVQSLYVIRPEELRLRFFTEQWPDENPRPKQLCLFRYRGVEYKLKLTDPKIIDFYKNRIPRLGQPPLEVLMESDEDLLVCVSLAGVYRNYHYKVVATVYEGPG